MIPLEGGERGTVWLRGRAYAVWIERRPAYCDRGHWRANVEPMPGAGPLFSIDPADGFPRYYMDFDRMVAELRDWIEWRESNGPAAAGTDVLGALEAMRQPIDIVGH